MHAGMTTLIPYTGDSCTFWQETSRKHEDTKTRRHERKPKLGFFIQSFFVISFFRAFVMRSSRFGSGSAGLGFHALLCPPRSWGLARLYSEKGGRRRTEHTNSLRFTGCRAVSGSWWDRSCNRPASATTPSVGPRLSPPDFRLGNPLACLHHDSQLDYFEP
jgi:hypothetical protein